MNQLAKLTSVIVIFVLLAYTASYSVFTDKYYILLSDNTCGVARVVQHRMAGEGPAALVRLGHEGAAVGPQRDKEPREAREVGEGGVVRPRLVEGGG